jgi:hypothetical protein
MPVQRYFQTGKIDDMTEQRGIQTMAAGEHFMDRVSLQFPGRPPSGIDRLAHTAEVYLLQKRNKSDIFSFLIHRI